MQVTILVSSLSATAVAVTRDDPFTFIRSIWDGRRAVDEPEHASEDHGVSDELWQHDCFKRVPAYGLLQSAIRNPGAGMNPDAIVPYQTVLKDGFLAVACVKDAMYESGDKFGNNKFQYKMAPIANSSIVHYTDIIPKEDQKAMTPSICFEFCRGIPDMGYFGISNGRDCYCTSYYEPMASDSSNCDSVCEGDTGMMCGGKSKNSIFGMHLCDQTEEDLKKATKAAFAVEHHLEDVCGGEKTVSESVAKASQSMQKAFGQIGDPAASNLMQRFNVYAGEWLHESESCLDFAANVKSLGKHSKKLQGKDLKKYANRKDAEDHLAKLQASSTEGSEMLEKHAEDWKKAQPMGSDEHRAGQLLPMILEQYYSVMYFVDKEYADDAKTPVTCDGDVIGEPALGLDAQHCAAACDDMVGKCVGFSAYSSHSGNENAFMCILFSKFTSVQYYTGCDKNTNFLQQHHDVVSGFAARHRHEVHAHRHDARAQQACAKRRASTSCQEARAKISPGGKSAESCYLAPNGAWKFPQLPAYYHCLSTCCEDYDPSVYLDELTCDDVMGFIPCDGLLSEGLGKAPPGSKTKTICSKSCEACDAPAKTTTTTSTPAPPVSSTANVKVIKSVVEKVQSGLSTEIKVMCRAKLSKFSGISLKPDKSGKNKYALKELTKAKRCFD